MPLAFYLLLWYFGVPMIAEQKRRYYSLKAVIAALGHSFPEAKRLFLDVAKRDGQFDPVRVLSRMQCLFILRYPWVSLDDYGSAGSIGTRLIEGKALDMVAKAKNKAEASVLRAAAVTQDAVLEIHSQDAVLLAHPDAPTAASPTLSPSTQILDENCPSTNPFTLSATVSPAQPGVQQPAVDEQVSPQGMRITRLQPKAQFMPTTTNATLTLESGDSDVVSGGRFGTSDIEEVELEAEVDVDHGQAAAAEGGGGGGGSRDEENNRDTTEHGTLANENANSHAGAEEDSEATDDDDAEHDIYGDMTDDELRRAVSEKVDELVKNVSCTCCT